MYAKIKEILNTLNNDNSHFINSNDICTPMECVEEMINLIPTELWERKEIDVLDPCTGNGNFVAYLQTKQKNTMNIFANEINKQRVNNFKKIFPEIKITEVDYLEYSNDKKFDLIIANPPYAKMMDDGERAAKNHNLSRDFILKSISLIKENGYLVFIVPDNWMSLADRNILPKILTEKEIIYINIHGAKKYFPKVGSSFTWFIIKNTNSVSKTIVDNFYKKNERSYFEIPKKIESIPLFYNEEVREILNKTIYSKYRKIKVETTSDLHKTTKKQFLSNERNEEHCYKIIHTQGQTIWSSKPHKYQDGYKVFISLTSYYSTFIDDCGMTQSIAFVRCNNLEEAKKIQNILNHPLYIFLNNIHRYGNFNNIRILQLFPMPEDEDIFTFFDIKENERKVILDFLKTT